MDAPTPIVAGIVCGEIVRHEALYWLEGRRGAFVAADVVLRL